jgi:hypothetical protein
MDNFVSSSVRMQLCNHFVCSITVSCFTSYECESFLYGVCVLAGQDLICTVCGSIQVAKLRALMATCLVHP